jgi:predicted O-methyltransferase YrrM
VDNDPGRAAEAAANLGRAGLAQVVDQQVGDAAEVLATSADGSWSMIFLDAERPAYVGYWPQLRRVLSPGGLLVVDNCLSHADEVAEFRDLVQGCDDVESTLLTVGAGLLLITTAGPPARQTPM